MLESPMFDVFLCHNSKEKAEVEKIREQLKQSGIYAWLDKYDFEPFRRWQDQLEEIISQIKTVAIFLGSSGVGPWADIEMREFLVEFAQRQIRMGLVILPDCPDKLIETVPRFMRGFHRVDFRQSEPDPMEQLIWGITGVKPKLKQKSSTSGHPSEATGSPLPEPKLEEVELNSEKNVDYTKLRDLLAAGEWEEADDETGKLLCQITGRDDRFFREVDYLSFPSEDLCTIDKLWIHYSKGRYGFSAQREIWKAYGQDRRNIIAWKKFTKEIEEPKKPGHFPIKRGGSREFFSLMTRLDAVCSI